MSGTSPIDSVQPAPYVSNDPYVAEAQKALNNLYGAGTVPVSGHLDPSTQSALTQFQADAGLPTTGRPDAQTLQALRNPAMRAPEPPTATLAQSSAQQADNMLRASIVKESAHAKSEMYVATGTNEKGQLHTEVGLVRMQSKHFDANVATGHVTFDPENGNVDAQATLTSLELSTAGDEASVRLDLLTAKAYRELLHKNGKLGLRFGASAAVAELSGKLDDGANEAGGALSALGAGGGAGLWVQDRDGNGHPEVCVEATVKIIKEFDVKNCVEVTAVEVPGLHERLGGETIGTEE